MNKKEIDQAWDEAVANSKEKQLRRDAEDAVAISQDREGITENINDRLKRCLDNSRDKSNKGKETK